MQTDKPIDTLTPAEINREFAERAGLCWHEIDDDPDNKTFNYCKKCGEHSGFLYLNGKVGIEGNNPDFYANPVELLKVAMEGEDWPEFSKRIGFWANEGATCQMFYIRHDYLTTPGLLAKARLAWLRERGGK